MVICVLVSQCHRYVPGSDNKVILWNVGTGEAVTEIDFPDIPLSASWSFDGTKFVVSCKDRKVRVVDPRTKELLKVRNFLIYNDYDDDDNDDDDDDDDDYDGDYDDDEADYLIMTLT